MRLSPRAGSPSAPAMELCTRYDGAGRYGRKRGRRAVHLDRTYIGGRKREALARGERMRFFRRSVPSGITTCKERRDPPLSGTCKVPSILSAPIRNPACSKSSSETARAVIYSGCFVRFFS